MGVIIRRRSTPRGLKEKRIKTQGTDPRITFKDNVYKFWMEDLQSGKPWKRYRPVYQHPQKGKWSMENPEVEPENVLVAQRGLAYKYQADSANLNRLMTKNPII